MPDMKSTSASVYGSRPSPGGVAWRPRAGAPAHAAVATARSRDTRWVARDRMLFPSARDSLTLTPPGLAGCQMCAHDVRVQRDTEARLAGHLNEPILDVRTVEHQHLIHPSTLAGDRLERNAIVQRSLCQGCSTVGVLAYRFISRTSFCPHPGSSCTVSRGELIGVILPPLVTLTS